MAAKAVVSADGSAPARPTSGSAATAYELQRARLGVDLRQLREIQSLERKIERKGELLPAYVDWIDGVLAADNGCQDDIVVQVMIWRIDTGDYAGALPLIDHVLRWHLALPERFNRTAPTLIVEEIADAALKSLGQGGDFDLPLLQRIAEIGDAHDMPDQVRAKMMKALGLQLARVAEGVAADADGPAGARRGGLDTALRHLRRALDLDGRCGVKKELDRVERLLRKEPSTPPASGD